MIIFLTFSASPTHVGANDIVIQSGEANSVAASFPATAASSDLNMVETSTVTKVSSFNCWLYLQSKGFESAADVCA